MKTSTLVCAVVLNAACSSTNSSRYDLPGGTPDTTVDTSAQEPEDTGYIPAAGASWFGLEGEIRFEETGNTLSLKVHFYEDGQTETPLCSVDTDFLGLVAHDLTPDPTVHYWANTRALLTLDGSTCFDSTRLPEGELQIGLGELHSAVLPILEAKGLGEIAQSSKTMGSYVGFNETAPTDQNPGSAFVLGYALPESEEGDQLEDSSTTVKLHGLFLFPLTETEIDTGTPSDQ